MPDLDAQDQYKQHRKRAKRYVSEHGDDQWQGLLPVLEQIVPNLKELPTVSLGIIDVPMTKVRGTVMAGRAAAFAGNFLPLLSEVSEFGSKWASLYNAHIREGIRDPGTAIEYLGYYYIIEGHKRVSVLHAFDAASIQLDVSRALPPMSDDLEVQLYLEMLDGDSRTPFRNMWFSRLGSYPALRAMAAEYENEHPDTAEGWVHDAFLDFRKAYHEVDLRLHDITTGDAFLACIKVYGFPYLRESGLILQQIQLLEPQLQYLNGTPKLLMRVMRPKIPRAVFVYDQTPQTRFWDAAHDYGRRRVAHAFPEVALQIVTNASAADMSEMVSAHPNGEILFFVSGIAHGDASLRALLDQKDSIIWQCSPLPRQDVLPTFYGDTTQPAFVLGALAASLSTTGQIGWIDAVQGCPLDSGIEETFAMGATMVSDRAKVWRTTWGIGDTLSEVLCRFDRVGVDMVLIPTLTEAQGGHAFPGVFAQLARLKPTGNVSQYIAAIGWDFGSLYTSLCGAHWFADNELLTSLYPGAAPVHLKQGLQEGLLRLYYYHAALSPYAHALAGAMTTLVGQKAVALHPPNPLVLTL